MAEAAQHGEREVSAQARERCVCITHQEIADMIGATRQTVTSIMSYFKRRRMLETHDHIIHIIDKRLFGTLLK